MLLIYGTIMYFASLTVLIPLSLVYIYYNIYRAFRVHFNY